MKRSTKQAIAKLEALGLIVHEPSELGGYLDLATEPHEPAVSAIVNENSAGDAITTLELKYLDAEQVAKVLHALGLHHPAPHPARVEPKRRPRGKRRFIVPFKREQTFNVPVWASDFQEAWDRKGELQAQLGDICTGEPDFESYAEVEPDDVYERP